MFSNWTRDWANFTREQKTFLIGWAGFLIVAGGLTLYVMGEQQYRNLQDSIARHSARVEAGEVEAGHAGAMVAAPPGQQKIAPREVNIGAYVDRVAELSILGSTWKADFYLWFNWDGPDLNPGENFHVVNGEVLSKILVEKQDKGDHHYALYRVMAQITKTFSVARFPRDDHMLTINIEDGASQSDQLRFVADDKASDISSRVEIPGYKVLSKHASIRPHSYKTSRGNPDLPPDYKATYSQFVYGVWMARPTWGMHFKMFVVLYGAVLVALLALFVKSSCDRLCVVTGSLLAVFANMYITSTLIPDTGILTLADQLNWIGAAFIVVAVIQSVIYQYHFENQEGKEAVIKFYDFMSFGLMLPLYVILNVAIPVLASV